MQATRAMPEFRWRLTGRYEKDFTTGHSPPQSKPLAQMNDGVTYGIGQFSTYYGACQIMVVDLGCDDGTCMYALKACRRAYSKPDVVIIIGNEECDGTAVSNCMKIFKFTENPTFFYGCYLET